MLGEEKLLQAGGKGREGGCLEGKGRGFVGAGGMPRFEVAKTMERGQVKGGGSLLDQE